jgi:hypothetical protein
VRDLYCVDEPATAPGEPPRDVAEDAGGEATHLEDGAVSGERLEPDRMDGAGRTHDAKGLAPLLGSDSRADDEGVALSGHAAPLIPRTALLMNTMQAMFESLLKLELSFPRFALRLVVDRLRDRGITLTRSQRAALQDRLKNLRHDDLSLALKITDAQLAGSKLTADERSARRISLDLDADRIVASVEKAIPSIILGCVANASDLIWKKLRREAPAMLKDRRRERRGFETRLARRWGRALDLLATLREIAVEAGDDFNTEFRPEPATAKDFVFEVLTRLHARACQVASEVIILLRSGHADGAHARWRTLHEIAVVGFFVRSHGNDVAERYILHNAIESYRAALGYQEHCTTIG